MSDESLLSVLCDIHGHGDGNDKGEENRRNIVISSACRTEDDPKRKDKIGDKERNSDGEHESIIALRALRQLSQVTLYSFYLSCLPALFIITRGRVQC